MDAPTVAARRWERILQEQRASGLSVAVFCRRRGVPPPSFYAWRRRLGGAAAPAFVEVKLAPPREADPPEADAPAAPPGATLELLLPSDRRVLVRPGFDPHLLRELLAALEAQA